MLTAGDKIGRYTVLSRIGSAANGEPLYEVSCDICSKDTELYADNFKGTEYSLKNDRLVCGCSNNFNYSLSQYEIMMFRSNKSLQYEVIGDFSNTKGRTEVKVTCSICGHIWNSKIKYIISNKTSCKGCRISPKLGKISDNRKLIYGKGINDADYITQAKKYPEDKNSKEKIRCPFYLTWRHMLMRCFSEKIKNKYNTYKDVTCCEEWLTFSNFKSWMEQQDWEGKQLDKDLIVQGNKIYSPDTCVFVTSSVNNFLLRSGASRGDLPLGVTKASLIHGKYEPTKKYAACCGHTVTKNNKRTSVRLGCFKNITEAHRAWQLEKISQAKKLKNEQNDQRVKDGLQRVIDKIQYDYDNNLITEDF